MIPSPAQAKVYWLHASGVSVKEIASMLSVSRENAQATLDAARKKAAKIGLSYKLELKEKQEMPIVESGLSIAMTLAREANLIK